MRFRHKILKPTPSSISIHSLVVPPPFERICIPKNWNHKNARGSNLESITALLYPDRNRDCKKYNLSHSIRREIMLNRRLLFHSIIEVKALTPNDGPVIDIQGSPTVQLHIRNKTQILVEDKGVTVVAIYAQCLGNTPSTRSVSNYNILRKTELVQLLL